MKFSGWLAVECFHVQAFLGSGKYVSDHGLKGFERELGGGVIEGGVVVFGDKSGGAFEVLVFAKLVAHVPVQAHKVEEVITLEDGVILHHPVVGLGYEWLHDGGANIGVVGAAKCVADVVQQGADDVLLVLARIGSELCGLQGVLEAVDGKAAVVAAQQL